MAGFGAVDRPSRQALSREEFLTILQLPAYNVLNIESTEHDYYIVAEPMEPRRACPHCQSSSTVGFGRREQLVKDLPIHGKRVGIYVDTRRFQCRTCNRTFFERLPDVDERRAMTIRLVKWIGQQSLKRTFTSIAEEVGITEGTVRLIFKDFVSDLERTVSFETPKWIGINQIHIIKPRCIITNIESNTVIDVLVDRNKDTVAEHLFQMKHRDEVQFVAMDIWAQYRDAVIAVMPQAEIVIDKFHVVKMANDAMEKARKGIRANLDLKHKRGLMRDRFVLLKRQRDLTDKEAFNLDGWTKNYPVLGEVYHLKESFYAVYEASTSKEGALARYEAWSKSVPPEIRPHFADLIRAFTNWQPWILNYFDHKVTNAYTGSLNSLMRVMDRVGRGYSFEALRAKILFTEGAHKRTRLRPKCERTREPEWVAMGFGGPEEASGFGLPRVGRFRRAILAPRIETLTAEHQYGPSGRPKNYGADISTLVSMIETGDL